MAATDRTDPGSRVQIEAGALPPVITVPMEPMVRKLGLPTKVNAGKGDAHRAGA